MLQAIALAFSILTMAVGAVWGAEQVSEQSTLRFSGDYLGQVPPSGEARIFDTGDLAGEPRVFNIAFSPAGDELFFSYNKSTPDRTGPDYEIKHMLRVGDKWRGPETAWFSGVYSDCDLTFSPAGDRIFFASKLRPHPITGSQMDIYYMERTDEGWSDPIHAGTEVNTEHGEVHASMSELGNLFFRSGRAGGRGGADIWRAEWIDGEFVNAQNLGPAINTQYMETDCFIAADESYILFNTIRPEHGERPQIYGSFKRDDGTWTTGRSLGPAVNCKAGSMGSVVSPDGKYLFYTSRCSGERAVQWISTEVIYRLRDEALLSGSSDVDAIKLPPDQCQVFMDGLVSRVGESQMNAALTADGSEFFFCAIHRGRWSILSTRKVGGRWLEPEPLPFTAGFTDRDFTMSPDGRRLYFGSNRPRDSKESPLDNLDIVVSEITADGRWSEPVNIGPPVNTDAGENYPSVAANGNLYFFSCRKDGAGGCDLYRSERRADGYEPPVLLGPGVNSELHDWDAFVAPDESYLIFSSQDRPDSVGAQDLYISFRNEDGSWTEARNMGPRVNSPSDEICPSVSVDREILFFTSRRRGDADVYWMSSVIITELKP